MDARADAMMEAVPLRWAPKSGASTCAVPWTKEPAGRSTAPGVGASSCFSEAKNSISAAGPRPFSARSAATEIRNEAEELGPKPVSNVRENGKPVGSIPGGEIMIHTPYVERPRKATVPYAVEVPSTGGNTLFANCHAAAETLPADIKRRLAGRKAVHAFEYGATRKSGRRGSAAHHAHPVFRKHPATGRSALFVSELMTEEIVGLPEKESRGLLDLPFARQRRPEFVSEHVRRPGDLRDNRCSIHARTDFPREERRMLRRLTVLDEHPVLMSEPPGLPA